MLCPWTQQPRSLSPPEPSPTLLPSCNHRPHSLRPPPAGGLAPCPTAGAARPILGHKQGFILCFLSILDSFIKLKWLLWDVNNYIFLKKQNPGVADAKRRHSPAAPRLWNEGRDQVSGWPVHSQAGLTKSSPIFSASVSHRADNIYPVLIARH